MHAAGGRLGYVREAVCVACMREPSGVVMGTGVARGVMLWTGEPWRGKKCVKRLRCRGLAGWSGRLQRRTRKRKWEVVVLVGFYYHGWERVGSCWLVVPML